MSDETLNKQAAAPPEGGRRETRRFRLHEHEILKDIITRQAGTLTKALLETVMNAADAGATEIDIAIGARTCVIRDNGRGFISRDEIETNFEVFGQPQTEEERGRKTYGEFRMGRGQAFHFGKNLWRTNTFQMEVDVQKCLDERTGFQYDLIEDVPEVAGCDITINLYRPLSSRDVSQTAKELKQRVRYVPAHIKINGRVVTVDPETENWTIVNDDAYIRLSEHGHTLEVFNRGIFVEEFERRAHGAAGVIVSKRKLTVNFARNEIISSCPVWRRISENFDVQAEKRIKRKFTLDEEERANVISRVAGGEMEAYTTWQMQILMDATGQPWSPQAIARAAFPQFTTAFRGDSRADTLIQTGLCLVLDQETVDLFDLDDPAELFTKYPMLRTAHPPVYVPYDQVAVDLSDECLPVPKHRWTPSERIWLEVIRHITHSLTANNVSYQDDDNKWRRAADLVENPKRVVRIGSSKVCHAWTDGETYIFISREWLERQEPVKHDLPYFRDIFRVGQVIAAQLCFSSDSRRSGHSPDFYKCYYELSKLLPGAVAEAASILSPVKFDQLKKRVTEEARTDQKKAAATGTAETDEDEADVNSGKEEEEWPDVIGEKTDEASSGGDDE
jgi:Histidine kinase-, DNA gyrase B-, and HSP90-like ATPase